MDVKELKNYIYENQFVEQILESISCHHIRYHASGTYWTYDVTEYQEGLNMCLWLLDKCDEMWVFGEYEDSVGCMSEIAYCQNYLIPYHIIEQNCLGIREIPCRKCYECGLVDYDEYTISCQAWKVRKIYDEL